jgi:hypothetical protein
MKFMVQSMQRPNLTEADNARLYTAMNGFYTNIPEGVTLMSDFIRADKLGSYSVLEVPDRATMDAIMAPFDGLVIVDIVEVLTAKEAMG